jgi:hypothetical protein
LSLLIPCAHFCPPLVTLQPVFHVHFGRGRITPRNAVVISICPLSFAAPPPPPALRTAAPPYPLLSPRYSEVQVGCSRHSARWQHRHQDSCHQLLGSLEPTNSAIHRPSVPHSLSFQSTGASPTCSFCVQPLVSCPLFTRQHAPPRPFFPVPPLYLAHPCVVCAGFAAAAATAARAACVCLRCTFGHSASGWSRNGGRCVGWRC